MAPGQGHSSHGLLPLARFADDYMISLTNASLVGISGAYASEALCSQY
jgi:hypothetical protein